ncbi:MAG: penicillin acylase family protein [Candidatus Binatia bacterium]
MSTAPLPPKRRLAMLAGILDVMRAAPRPRTIPALDAANLPPLRGRLEVIRDGRGIPHIYAEEEADLYAALGYLQAADRFFFVDVIRHLGAGRLVQLLGDWKAPGGNDLAAGRRVGDIDRFVRPFGFEAQSRADFDRCSPRVVALLTAFADGVNAALRALQGAYPPEYLLAGPLRPWHPADCLLAGRTCAFVVSLTAFENELVFDAVRGQLGDAFAQRLFPEAPWADVPTSYAARGPEPEPELPLHGTGGGSNNWAVDAAHSASGAPLVANDPHVPFMPLPTFWHHVHLECPAYRVQGGVFPGCPVFGFGHNGALAWGCTTGFRDGYDLYRIHRLPEDATRYRTEHGSGAITRQREELPTRFGRRIVHEWESCEHGILYPGWRHHDGVELAVRAVPSDLAHYVEGYLALAEAQTVEQHRAGLALINDGPFDFNHTYGHRDGHIGWELFGRVPRRTRDGLFVRDAQDPDAQWRGWVPFEEMPKQLNPPRGFVATANSATDAQHTIAFTVTHCEPRYRTARIETLLAAQPTHTTESFAALQADVVGDYAPALRDAFVAAIGTVAGNDVGAAALDTLRQWDGRFPADSSGGLIFALMQQDLPQRLFRPLLGALGGRYANGRKAMPRMHALLLDAADPLRADLERAACKPLAELVRESFFAAVNRAASRQGVDPTRWRWGTTQRVWLGTALALLPLVGRRFRAFEGPFPGDEYTVNPSRSIPMRGTLYALVGATSRFICDLSKPDEALFAHSSGPSADPRTTYFASTSASWHRFEYFRSALWPAAEVPDPVERVVVGPR